MRAIKKRAADQGTTITRVIEQAVRESLAQQKKGRSDYKLSWAIVKGRVHPGVDLTDRDALFNRMEGRD